VGRQVPHAQTLAWPTDEVAAQKLAQYEQIGQQARDAGIESDFNSKSTYQDIARFFEVHGPKCDVAWPFVCIIESSGCGKTQLAFSAPTDCKVLYVPMITKSTYMQPIYKNFVALAALFTDCLKSDWGDSASEKGVDTDSVMQKLEGRDAGSWYLLGLLDALNDHLGCFPSAILSAGTISPVAMTFEAFTKAREGADGKDKWANVFAFIDEAQHLERDTCILRNVLRILRIRTILMSTHSSVANFVEQSRLGASVSITNLASSSYFCTTWLFAAFRV